MQGTEIAPGASEENICAAIVDALRAAPEASSREIAGALYPSTRHPRSKSAMTMRRLRQLQRRGVVVAIEGFPTRWRLV